MNRSRWLPVGAGLIVAGVGILLTQASFTSSAKGQGRVVPPEAVHDVDIMQEKLTTAQNVLTGLVNRDSDAIVDCGRKLSALCKTDAWQRAGKDPVYTHFSVEFQRQADHLAKMGINQNFEGAAFVYQGLTATCVACHEHVRNMSPIEQAK